MLELSGTKGFHLEQVTETTTGEPTATATLNSSDRCDSCGAQAYVRVTLASGELLFCSHHANEVKEKLEAIALSWQDETDRLLAR